MIKFFLLSTLITFSINSQEIDKLCYCNSEDYKTQINSLKKNYHNSPNKNGPGFLIRNETFHTLDISLEDFISSGPKYWGMIKPGEIFDRKTGDFIFDIVAQLNVDGKERFNTWDAVWPVALDVGSLITSAYYGGTTVWAKNAVAGLALRNGTVSVMSEGVKWALAKSLTKETAIYLAKSQYKDVLLENFSETNSHTKQKYEITHGSDRLELYRIIGGPGIPCLNADNTLKWEGSGLGKTTPLKIIAPGVLPNDLAESWAKTDFDPTNYTFMYYDKYQLQIDCDMDGVDNESTTNNITVVFWSEDKKISEVKRPAKPNCDWISDDSQFYTWSERMEEFAGGQPITRVDIIIDGNDAFFIDELSLTRENYKWERPRKNGLPQAHNQTYDFAHWGKNGGKGYCLSTDPNDGKGAWKSYVDGCYRGITFMVKDNEAFPLQPDPVAKITTKVDEVWVSESVHYRKTNGSKWIKIENDKVIENLSIVELGRDINNIALKYEETEFKNSQAIIKDNGNMIFSISTSKWTIISNNPSMILKGAQIRQGKLIKIKK